MARKTITISVPEDLKNELDQLTKEEGISRSDILRESLRDYLLLRRFRGLRGRMIRKAEALGVFTDEDVFEIIS
ncbi:MAG TPA: ribbon-helix-helix domain-containing protein [Oligoflexia bacterium]|nr:ribbon-helix-helix domain-containing protein [Oligoflexia bacterium]HMP49564.1 ribbon-helix-helix domain-containing protein [Oligoflexia bacterium]